MPTYATPGVYYERVDAGAPPLSPLRTDVAGFVGIARRGPLHRAVPVESWRQFEAWFGGVTGAGYLAYAARGFFECGGRRAWIVRVASPAAATARTAFGTISASSGWRVTASSAGVWGNDLDVRLTTTHRAQTRSVPADSTPEYAAVRSVAGFVRGTHVRVPVGPALATAAHRIVAFVDPETQRLYWIHPDPRQRRPWEQPLTGVDLNASLVVESVEYDLLVFMRGRLLERHDGLSLVPEHPRYGPAAAPGLPSPPADARGWSVPLAPPLVAVEEGRDAAAIALAEPLATAGERTPLTGGADGLGVLTVRDFIGEPTSPLDSDLVIAARTRGLRALEPVAEVSVIGVPDIHIQPEPPPDVRPLPPCEPDPCLPAPPPGPAPPRPSAVGDLPPRFDDEEIYQVQAAMVAHCESLRTRVAILDPPFDTARDPRLGQSAIRAWRRRFDTTFAALYYPWVSVSDSRRRATEPTRAVPPSGHVAGFIARTDLAVGVHKAPANGPLAWIQNLTIPVGDAAHGVLNDEHVNAIRAFPGRGIRIFGARTVSRHPDFRYLNIRRFLLMLEQACALGCRWAVFEPNNPATRARLHLALTSFLLAQWQKGALAGHAPQAAFFVRCDETNNPAEARVRGRLTADVGVAPVTPFEFVVVRVGRVDDQFEVEELGLARETTA